MSSEFEGHTPGPWFAWKNSAFWQIDAPEFGQIGDACASSASEKEGFGSMALGEANAKLMAAAPSLLSRALAAEAKVEKLREALELIESAHIPDQPAASHGDELTHCARHVGYLRGIARATLATEPPHE